MRRPYTAVIVAALGLTVCAGISLALSACGSSHTDAAKQAKQSWPQQGGGQMGGQMGDPSAMFTSALAKLVTNGTITSAQRDAVVAVLKTSMTRPGTKGGMQPSPGAQPNSGAQPGQGAQQPNTSGMFTKALAKLVDNGTITKAQQTAISKALRSGFAGGGAPPGGQLPGNGTY